MITDPVDLDVIKVNWRAGRGGGGGGGVIRIFTWLGLDDQDFYLVGSGLKLIFKLLISAR